MAEGPLKVVVALIGPATVYAPPFDELNRVEAARRFVGIQASPDLSQPYGALRKVTLDARPAEPVACLLARAAEAFGEDTGHKRGPVGLRLYEPALDQGFSAEERATAWERIPFVDPDMRLWWRPSSELDLPYGG